MVKGHKGPAAKVVVHSGAANSSGVVAIINTATTAATSPISKMILHSVTWSKKTRPKEAGSSKVTLP